MKLAVFSDTHGNSENLLKAGRMASDMKAETFVHLGDDEEDMYVIEELRKPVISVPGLFGKAYMDPGVSNRLIKDFVGFKILFTHSPVSTENDLPEDVRPESLVQSTEINAMFYGHTHVFDVGVRGGIFYLNPGHLRTSDKRGLLPTFALVEITAEKLGADIISLTGRPVASGALMR